MLLVSVVAKSRAGIVWENAFLTVCTGAGVVLGGAVRGGTKALQRLTAQERLQDLHVASQHLEATASGVLLDHHALGSQWSTKHHTTAAAPCRAARGGKATQPTAVVHSSA